MKTGYLLLIEDAIILDCCAARKRELAKEYRVQEMVYIEHGRYSIPHCGLTCLKEQAKGPVREK